MRVKDYQVVIVYADGHTMSGEAFKKNGHIIRPENNPEVNNACRCLCHPELVIEEGRQRRREYAAKRREALLAELKKIHKDLI